MRVATENNDALNLPATHDALGTVVRYELVRTGTDPQSQKELMAAIATGLQTRQKACEDQEWRGEHLHRVIVPIPETANPETVLRRLHHRVKQPLSPGVDVILQTSGSTTGRGHLVGLSLLACRASASATLARLGGPGRWVLALPPHHVAGFQMLVRSVLAGIDPVNALQPNGFDPHYLADSIRAALEPQDAPVYVSLVPTQLVRILDLAEQQPDEHADAAQLRAPLDALKQTAAVLVGGAGLDARTMERVEHHGIPVVTTYGMTETSGGCVYDGLPLKGTQIAVVNERVWISGTTLMEGYVDSDDRDEFVYSHGRRWLRTTDLGRMDGAYLQITGREDDVINTGGIKIEAGPVARAVKAVPGVADAMVVGLSDRQWGQVVTAVITVKSDVDPELLESLRGGPQHDDDMATRIRLQVAAELGRIHAPRVIALVEELPLMGVGKLDRDAVKELAVKAISDGKAWVR